MEVSGELKKKLTEVAIHGIYKVAFKSIRGVPFFADCRARCNADFGTTKLFAEALAKTAFKPQDWTYHVYGRDDVTGCMNCDLEKSAFQQRHLNVVEWE